MAYTTYLQKYWIIFNFVIFLSLSLLVINYYYMANVGSTFSNLYYEGLNISIHDVIYNQSSTCILPNFGPFDASIRKYIKKMPAIQCSNIQYPITYVDSNRVLHINQTAVDVEKIAMKDLRCSYQEIVRPDNDDNKISLGTEKEFLTPMIITKEFIVVRCHDKKRKQLVYETGYASVLPVKPSLALSSRRALQEGAVNVLVLAMDSMSRLNFIRQLPKSYEFMQNKLNASVLRGLTKNGINTYPNMVTMLCGISQYDYKTKSSQIYLDDLPAVWNNFSSRGYVTMFGEDLPKFAIFNHLTQGFRKPPTDFYMRPFWLAMDEQNILKSRDSRCYGHLPKYQFLWNYTEQFVVNMHQSKHAFFAFSFLTGMSHDNLNSIQLVDDDLLRMLTHFHETGVFENTLFLLMGDHGQRIDEFRSTNKGRIEDNMPFLAINLPTTLQHLRKNLEANTGVLTGWSDVYEMLIDVAIDNLEPRSKQERYGKLGLSLLRPIPSNRTCRDLGITEEFCVCGVEHDIDVNSDQALSAAISVIYYLNDKLSVFSQLCAKLELDFVERAQIILPSAPRHEDEKDKVFLMRVTVMAKPEGALLEATLQSTAWTSNSVIGDINRINKYGNQSICIDDVVMRQYCSCIT